MITDKTSLIGIFKGTWEDLRNQFFRLSPYSVDKKKVERLAKLYVQYGASFNIRADIAWGQMEHETAFLLYPRQVKAYSNNFAGLGAIEGTGQFAVFKTERLGVIAHLIHLAWYIFPEHINNYCSVDFDPRHNVFSKTGKHNYNGNYRLETLNKRWAGSSTYVKKIVDYASQIFVSDSLTTKSEKITEKIKSALNIKTDYNWTHIAIHHSVSSPLNTTMDMIRRWHLARGFIREGYNFGINGYGVCEIGRPLNMQGAHVAGWNTKAIGVCLYGDFRTDILTPEQKETALEIVTILRIAWDIPVENVLGHKEFSGQHTACPCIDMNKFRLELNQYYIENHKLK